jgi:hypothetical protein
MYLNNIKIVHESYFLVFNHTYHSYDFNFNKFAITLARKYQNELAIISNKAHQKYMFDLCDSVLYKIPLTLSVAYN